MSLLDYLLGGRDGYASIISAGRNKIGGGHDHRTNTGDDRTPSQKEGDKKRRKG